tara:strand:+ start:1962 stop:2312 length:351 start_codon:yes stop_codon:yes gene_type:complete
MAQDKMKQTMTDPMLEGTGQPGELADTPTVPSDVQDPALVGTGQPGELVGTPDTPSDDFIKELDKIRKQAKRKESMRVAQRMTMLDHLDLLDLKLTDFVKGPGVQGLLRHINEEGE